MEISIEVDPETVCRACMAVSPNMRPLFQTEEGCEQTPSDILSFVTNMIVKQEDKLPKHICHDCEVLMRQSCMFKRRCIDSETKFLMLHTDEKALLGITKKPYVKSENLVETSGSKLEQPYQCSICVLKFSDILSLYTHVRKIHSKIENASGIEVTLFSATKDNVVTPSLSTDDVKDNNQCIKEEILDANHFLEDDLENFESNLIEGESIYHASKENDKGYTAFTCSSCNVTLDSKVKYQEHIRDTHLTLSAIKKECKNNRKKSQTTERIIGKDNVVLSETKTFICEYCNLKLKTNKSYKNHIKRKHSEMRDTAITKLKVKEEKEVERKHQCSHCMRKFVKKSTLALHLKRHENSSCTHVCSICKREFKHRAHLDNHILSVHTSQNGLKCNICPKSFATQESLDLHKTMHSNEKKHQCKFCSKAFNMLSTLRDHLRVHTGEKPFLCPQCGKGFTQNTNLIEHLRRHQGIKPFKCDLCDRRFVSKGELAAHARKHTGAHPFVCDDCGGGFTTSSSLVKHRRTHTGERPYGCDLCHMKFAASGTLKNHRRTHTGEKPYKCTHCEKAFVQKNDLVAHTRCHTGERPYVCSTCGQAFRQGSALKAHLKMHQGKPALGRTGTI